MKKLLLTVLFVAAVSISYGQIYKVDSIYTNKDGQSGILLTGNPSFKEGTKINILLAYYIDGKLQNRELYIDKFTGKKEHAFALPAGSKNISVIILESNMQNDRSFVQVGNPTRTYN